MAGGFTVVAATDNTIRSSSTRSDSHPIPSARHCAWYLAWACTNGRRWRNRSDIAGRAAWAPAADRRAPGSPARMRGSDAEKRSRKHAVMTAPRPSAK